MTAKERHIQKIVGYATAGDLRGARRYYVENRVSYATYLEGLRKAKRVKRWFDARELATNSVAAQKEQEVSGK